MTPSIFQEKNLKRPEDVFNSLGNEQFGKEWSNIPLRILQGLENKATLKKRYVRNQHLADQTFKKFCEYLKDNNVKIYTTKHSLDSKQKDTKIVKWARHDFRISKSEFYLIETDTDKYGDTGAVSRRQFWIEMPKDKNPMSFNKPGCKELFNKEYIKSIFHDIAKTIEGRVTHEKFAYELSIFSKDKNLQMPKRTWVGKNLSKEIENENERRGF